MLARLQVVMWPTNEPTSARSAQQQRSTPPLPPSVRAAPAPLDYATYSYSNEAVLVHRRKRRVLSYGASSPLSLATLPTPARCSWAARSSSRRTFAAGPRPRDARTTTSVRSTPSPVTSPLQRSTLRGRKSPPCAIHSAASPAPEPCAPPSTSTSAGAQCHSARRAAHAHTQTRMPCSRRLPQFAARAQIPAAESARLLEPRARHLPHSRSPPPSRELAPLRAQLPPSTSRPPLARASRYRRSHARPRPSHPAVQTHLASHRCALRLAHPIPARLLDALRPKSALLSGTRLGTRAPQTFVPRTFARAPPSPPSSSLPIPAPSQIPIPPRYRSRARTRTPGSSLEADPDPS
ncbi:hypothetical protein B0H15DRAFT_955828 [Mycena belliarum]|uniref:Uncharacterized protein n=1 Tax=Mycena belliarum TaxID=1033014 RepID=A0AAD6XJT0_9AGAR|nr:hypothetical protein B0H15DRAFT_955828 [Mycena belliae]